MTPHEFVAKWRQVDVKERTGSHSHFLDLCRLLEIDEPTAADPKGEWFTFEKGVKKTGGGDGWADVWRKGCFAWEYKGPRKDLDKAFSQLLQYSGALDSPPLLIVSDMDRIRIHTNWTNTVQEVHEFTLEDLLDGQSREKLKRAFTDPEDFKPTKTRQALTEETAREFAGLAQRLRDRGHEAHQVAHFVNQLVFCMFAEDVGLLPDNLFTKMLDLCRSDPASFAEHCGTLFGAMSQPHGKVGFQRIDWFNGGLFQDDHALPVTRDDVEDLFRAAQRDWSQIDPSILGTLFERGLDPAKRSQLGAHYTDREKIMMIVQPVIIDPLEAEWAETKALIEVQMAKVEVARARTPEKQSEAKKVYAAARRAEETAYKEAQRLRNQFLVRLKEFRVLDPACGSGNFLYVALKALKDIEHKANIDAETLGLDKASPAVGPECVLGIELNPYAAELARVSVWIGEIQWMRRNGFDAAKNPILRNLDTIENRDAVLDEATGERAKWPQADVVVGNPPFLGNKKMITELGEDYTKALRKAWPQVPGGVDLVCYWFAGAWDRMLAGKLRGAGLVSTNSIRGGANREVLKPIVEHGRIFEAWSDEGWTVDGAAVRVSLVCFDMKRGGHVILNGSEITQIPPDLANHKSGVDLTYAMGLRSNQSLSFMGVTKSGPFDISGDEARSLLCRRGNPNGRPNSDVVKRSANGIEVVRRPTDRWILDFGPNSDLQTASLYEGPFELALEQVYPARQQSKTEKNREWWWRYERPRPEMYAALEPIDRYVGTAMVAKHRIFIWLHKQILPENLVIVIARDDDTTFGILHSRFHELWSLRMGTSLEDRPRYTPSTTFETFPFPEGLTPNIPAADYAGDTRAQAIAVAAARLNELRENWLNPADLVVREPEVVPGYPVRILPKDEAAAKELAKRTLTNLYNARPAWLDHAHRALDEAVAEAYGWGDDFRAGLLTDDEILARLFRLNQERAIND
ncbi:class I SAM-dependent DNA methyltransferase [Novosphingobium aquae]|uniref:site-specific DNA-methyltransferase (adenine-specific) n=1 Tax=Novosphingobium aquae TaxID=3133435 RepID=A0ABU8S5C7_9SPHN